MKRHSVIKVVALAATALLAAGVLSSCSADKAAPKAPAGSTTYKGNVVGVPIITEQEVLYYRKDLLKKAGLGVPKTMDELKAAAKAIKEQNPGVAGFVARTGKSAAVTQFSSFLYSSLSALLPSDIS